MYVYIILSMFSPLVYGVFSSMDILREATPEIEWTPLPSGELVGKNGLARYVVRKKIVRTGRD